MSTSVSDHQKSKRQGNGNVYMHKYKKNGEHDDDLNETDSWRNQNQAQAPHHHQGYNSSGMGTGGNDGFMSQSSYYGSFQYAQQQQQQQNYAPERPWSNGDSNFHDAPPPPPPSHYNNMESGIYNSAPPNPQFSNYPYQNFHPNQQGGGEFNSSWGSGGQRQRYINNDYYRPRDGYEGKMSEGMGGLSLGEKEMSNERSNGSSRKTTWASIASQPAKPQSLLKKKQGLSGMPPPPVMLGGAWDKNGSVAKVPIPAPVQAPHPPAWERNERASQQAPPPNLGQNLGPQPRGLPYSPHSMGYSGPSSGYSGPPPQQQQQQQTGSGGPNPNNQKKMEPPAAAAPPPTHVLPTSNTVPTGKKSPSAGPQYPDEAKMKSDYNPAHFDLNAEGARFFVIKSYSEDDIHRSIKYEIWTSTEKGNRNLDDAWREREGKGPIYLFFSVNGSGHFCGMAQMMSAVDYESSSSVWCQDKWKGQFKVKWIYAKDVPNNSLRHIKLANNENKPVTNSRDTQEVYHEEGKQVLKIIHSYQHTTTIFDDFVHYEKRQEEESNRRTSTSVPPVQPQNNQDYSRNERGGGRGGYHRGSHNNSNEGFHREQRPDFNSGGRGEYGSFHERGGGNFRGNQRGGGYERNYDRGENRGFDRERSGGDFYQRERGDGDFRGRGRGSNMNRAN